MIAMALACKPKLLIADEPTTALDVTIQAQILDLLVGLRRETGMGLVLITHDMGVVAETATRVVVQYAGHQVETNTTGALFADRHHPYTEALLRRCPSGRRGDGCPPSPAWCRDSSIDLPVACSRPAAASCSTPATRCPPSRPTRRSAGRCATRR